MDNDDPTATGAREVIDFVSSITDSARQRVEEHLAHGFVRLKVAEAERRQAHHDIRSVEDIVTELVRNSRDADARNVVVASQKEKGRFRRVTVIDDGCGIPEDMHNMVFEPRVTSRKDDFDRDRYGVHGRGMALFSIKSRATDACVAASEPGRGTSVVLTVDTEQVPERSDQATIPRLEQDGEGLVVGAGPHNTLRVLLEMSVDNPGMRYYTGSFAEALATVRWLSSSEASEGSEGLWSIAARAADARELLTAAFLLGLPVSERNAYRVFRNEVEPSASVMEEAMARLPGADAPKPRPGSPPPALRGVERTRNPLGAVSRDDVSELGSAAGAAIDEVLKGYFLKTRGEPKVRKGRGKLTISFYVGSDEEGES